MSMRHYGITDTQWEQLCAFFGGRCPRCGKVDAMSLDHITPIARGGKYYDIRNMQPLCLHCNISKNATEHDYRAPGVKAWAEREYEKQGDLRDAPSPRKRVFSAVFTEEWLNRIDLMAALKPEFPKGVTSVLQDGVELLWYKYGKLAEQMAAAAARVREDANEPA